MTEMTPASATPGAIDLDKALAPLEGAANSAKPVADDYQIRTSVFEGPLDLLLHLIRKEQVNIYDIPIAHICKQYLEHLELMKQLDVNVAGEFMVMASTLTYMKSLTLLPREEGETAEDDPRMPLVQQLLEYERFKKAANELDAIPWLYRDIYPRPASAIQESMPVESLMDAPLEPVDPFQLLMCLKAAMSRTTRPVVRITSDPTSIKEKVAEITVLLDTQDTIEFGSLMPEHPKSKDVIVSFLAVLELARLKYIEVLQHETFGPIFLRSVRSLRDLNQSMLDQY